jgi:hypothetical protein
LWASSIHSRGTSSRRRSPTSSRRSSGTPTPFLPYVHFFLSPARLRACVVCVALRVRCRLTFFSFVLFII